MILIGHSILLALILVPYLSKKRKFLVKMLPTMIIANFGYLISFLFFRLAEKPDLVKPYNGFDTLEIPLYNNPVLFAIGTGLPIIFSLYLSYFLRKNNDPLVLRRFGKKYFISLSVLSITLSIIRTTLFCLTDIYKFADIGELSEDGARWLLNGQSPYTTPLRPWGGLGTGYPILTYGFYAFFLLFIPKGYCTRVVPYIFFFVTVLGVYHILKEVSPSKRYEGVGLFIINPAVYMPLERATNDFLMVAFLVWGTYFFLKRDVVQTGLFLAFSVLCKYVSGVAMVPFLKHVNSKAKLLASFILIVMIGQTIMYLMGGRILPINITEAVEPSVTNQIWATIFCLLLPYGIILRYVVILIILGYIFYATIKSKDKEDFFIILAQFYLSLSVIYSCYPNRWVWFAPFLILTLMKVKIDH